MALFFWTGESDFLIQEKRKSWEKAFCEKHGDMNISVIDALDVKTGELCAELETMPFLAEKRLIFVKNLVPSAAKKIDSNKLDIILEVLENLPEQNIVVLLQSKPDKRTSFYKKLVKLVELEDFKPLQGRDLEAWIQKEVQKSGGKILPSAIQFLVEQVGTDLWFLYNEIQKLVSFAGNEKAISENDIQQLVIPQVSANIFALTDAIAAKNTKKAFQELSHIMDNGESLMQTFAMIIRLFRGLVLAKSFVNPTKEKLVKELKLHPFVAQNTLSQMKNFSQEKLKSIYKELLNIDTKLKTGGIVLSVNNETALAVELEKLILGLA